jgi:hypothetical protein
MRPPEQELDALTKGLRSRMLLDFFTICFYEYMCFKNSFFICANDPAKFVPRSF